MTERLWERVDGYLGQALHATDPILDAVLKASSEAGVPPIQVSPLQGKLLMLLARVLGARSILEIGTLAGYSTIWLARGLAAGGSIVTLEADAHHAKIAEANIARAGFQDRVELRFGRALKTLPALAAEARAPFDLVFIDADKKNIPDYFSWSLKLSRPGALIIVDNVVRDGDLVDERNREANIEGVRRFLAMAGEEQRVEGTAVQTVGIKGYDGFAILRVRD
jgi:predicted O-methyltransferase YrrM